MISEHGNTVSETRKRNHFQIADFQGVFGTPTNGQAGTLRPEFNQSQGKNSLTPAGVSRAAWRCWRQPGDTGSSLAVTTFSHVDEKQQKCGT